MSASWITKLNESDSRLHKQDVIAQALSASVLGSTNAINFLILAKACYNPYVTYGVKQIPNTVGIVGAENPWEDFVELLENVNRVLCWRAMDHVLRMLRILCRQLRARVLR